MTFVNPVEGGLDSLSRRVSSFREFTRFSVTDPAHFRVDDKFLAPQLERGTGV